VFSVHQDAMPKHGLKAVEIFFLIRVIVFLPFLFTSFLPLYWLFGSSSGIRAGSSLAADPDPNFFP